MTPRDTLKLVEDREFRKFNGYLAEQMKNGRFEITATLTGRFDAAKTTPCRDPESRCCPIGGYGHFGLSCARFVIQSVSAVVATPKNQSVPEHK
jgi:hypothetical protein